MKKEFTSYYADNGRYINYPKFRKSSTFMGVDYKDFPDYLVWQGKIVDKSNERNVLRDKTFDDISEIERILDREKLYAVTREDCCPTIMVEYEGNKYDLLNRAVIIPKGENLRLVEPYDLWFTEYRIIFDEQYKFRGIDLLDAFNNGIRLFDLYWYKVIKDIIKPMKKEELFL